MYVGDTVEPPYRDHFLRFDLRDLRVKNRKNDSFVRGIVTLCIVVGTNSILSCRRSQPEKFSILLLFLVFLN
jgi:hypothetical protein